MIPYNPYTGLELTRINMTWDGYESSNMLSGIEVIETTPVHQYAKNIPPNKYMVEVWENGWVKCWVGPNGEHCKADNRHYFDDHETAELAAVKYALLSQSS